MIGKHRLQAYPATVLCERCFDMTSSPKPKSAALQRSRANENAKQGNSPSLSRKKHGKE
jgi:hypothetical protein